MAEHTNDRFPSPFEAGGCVPVALTYLTGRWHAAEAVRLAHAAGKWFRWDSGVGWVHNRALPVWLRAAGLRKVGEKSYQRDFEPQLYTGPDGRSRARYLRTGCPTLAQFRRGDGAEGRWLVWNRNHAVAVIDGEAFGFYRQRDRIQFAVRVENDPDWRLPDHHDTP